ncbi:hypothetical protein CC2G_013408 [Coprinopsis cinerea AmutBmut pab1-1]|nr:hypothetical protein CC2G_013408 [Coprinopsis cinerea AmutBmut pab1-1]
MSSTIEEEKAARMALTALYTIIPVSFTVIGEFYLSVSLPYARLTLPFPSPPYTLHTAPGMQIVMCTFGFIIYRETPKDMRRGRRMYIIWSWTILTLFTLSQVADALEMFNLLINSTSPAQALRVLKPKYEYTWWRLSTSIGLWICNWIGDGLLLYRCFKIWSDKMWVCVLPALAYVGSCAVSLLAIGLRIKWSQNHAAGPGQYGKALQGWIFLSISVNCVVTALISFRLLRIRRQLATVLSPQDLHVYVGIVAILVESALPLSLAGIMFAALSSPSSDGAVTVARTVALLCWFSLNALCPQMIIFRVITGRSWSTSPSTDGPPGSYHRGTSTKIEFTNPGFSETKTDPEISFSNGERGHSHSHGEVDGYNANGRHGGGVGGGCGEKDIIRRRGGGPAGGPYGLNRVSEEVCDLNLNQTQTQDTSGSVVDVVRRRGSGHKESEVDSTGS